MEVGNIVIGGAARGRNLRPAAHLNTTTGRGATVAHELETLANGQTAFASARLTAWHQLGTVTDSCMTAQEVMSKAWLGGWEVRKIALQGIEVTERGVTKVDCPDKYMTVRTNPVTGETEYLGVVGEDYSVVQNEQVAETLNLLVDASGAHFETAGSMRKGRSVFVTMKLPTAMRIAGVDDMDLYLAATTSHDGTAALRLDATPVRIVCEHPGTGLPAVACLVHVPAHVERHEQDRRGEAGPRADVEGVRRLRDRSREDDQRVVDHGRVREDRRAGVAPRR
ncbi:hypothetical protein GCM10029963_72870 [Micromonospora andamanensis]